MTTEIRTCEEILATLREHKANLKREFPLKEIAIFGSWARGEQTSTSDVDILVEVEASIGLRFVTLAERIHQLLGIEIDLVSHRAIKPKMWTIIEQDLIYV